MHVNVSTIARHLPLYAPSGDVVLLAESETSLDDNSQTHYIAFRLHTSMLPIWSPQFASGIMSTLRSSITDEVYDGAPVVLMPDTASEVESLLNAAFHGL